MAAYSTYEELEALTLPFWTRVGEKFRAQQVERELHRKALARWEDDGGPVGEMPGIVMPNWKLP
jgi:hypothetical protein